MKYSINLFWNPRTRDYVLLNFAVDQQTHFCVSTGQFLRIPKDEMDSHGIQIVLAALAEFPKRDGSQRSELELMDKKQKSRFKSNHLMVSVSVDENFTSMEICPMEWRHAGGAIGSNEGKSILPLPSRQPDFLKAIELAFHHAT